MCSLEEMLLKVSGRHQNKINKFCQPLLTHFGINSFSYHKLMNTGGYYLIGNHVEGYHYYFSEKLHLIQPHFRHPQNFQSCVSLSRNIPDETYQQGLQKAHEKFGVHFGVVLINKITDGMEFIDLGVNSSSVMHEVLILNELPLIRKFIQKFIEENQFLFKLLEDNQVNLQEIIGLKFQKAEIALTASLPRRKQFLATLGIKMPESLSKRDDAVLKHLLEGNSASQIAKKLHLSCRTIEHYMERLKEKLICYSKADLIKKARELEEIGYFLP